MTAGSGDGHRSGGEQRLVEALLALLPESPCGMADTWRNAVRCVVPALLMGTGAVLLGLSAVVGLDVALNRIAPAPAMTRHHFIATAGQGVVVLSVALGMLRMLGCSPAVLGWRRPVQWLWLPAAIAGVLVSLACDRILDVLLLPHIASQLRSYVLHSYAVTHPAPAYQVVLACVVAPLVEETLFRGMLFAALRRFFTVLAGGTRQALPVAGAVLVSSALFGLAHADGLGLAPSRAITGAICALLYQRLGSLWPAVAVHTGVNAVAIYQIVTL